jgi:hypothetical protein
MPALRNLKHEAFARNLVEMTKSGGTQGNAYSKAGYRCENGAAEAAASRMLADVKNGVADRVRELMAGGAKLAEVTIQSLLAELEQARVAAQDDRQFSAAVQAIAGKARLTGLDNRESRGGSGGQFDRCETVEQVMAMLVAECGSAAQALADFDEMRSMIEAYAASHAQIVVAAEPSRSRLPGDETALSLRYLQPRRRRR